MSETDTMTSQATVVEFGADDLIRVAKAYAEAKRIVDASSRYDNLEDAVAALTEAWEQLESQANNGGRYTPAKELGFGSDNAATIADALLGRKPTVGATRKAFAALGK